MGSYSKTYRATAAPSVGTGWEDAANIYDNSTSTYCRRSSVISGNSAIHINGFGINNIPSNAVIDSIDVVTQMGLGNDNGYFCVFVYTDEGPTSILSTLVANGAEVDGKQTHSYSASTIQEKLNSKGVCNGDIKQLLKTLRVRFVGGSNDSSFLKMCGCNIYDNYVVVNYTIPDITYTYVNYDGTVLKTQTVEEGTSPTPPSNPTRPSTAEYEYTFSGWSLSGTTYTAQYTTTKREYLIQVEISPEQAGQSAGTPSWSYEYGSEVTLIVIPKNGYKFVKWNDNADSELIDWSGKPAFKRVVTVTEAKTYTAIFEPVYITFDSIFNFEKWKNNGIIGSNSVVSDITDMGFTLTSNSGVGEGTASSPYFPVEAGKSYKIDIDTIGDGWDVYIFFHSATSTGTGLEFKDATNRFSSNGSGNATRIFTAPEGSIKAQIRVDANGSNNEVSFSNFRIYPAECEYMSTTVAAEDRSNAISWDIPTPVRNGYEFLGWNTEPDGGGDAYTSDSTFPKDDLTLYSQWKDTSKVYCGTKKVSVYCGKQKVSVYCGTVKIL